MTYAKKLAADILQAQLLEDVPMQEAIAKGIEQAMKAKGEACAAALVSYRWKLENEYPGDYTEVPMYQAILNAEVQP